MNRSDSHSNAKAVIAFLIVGVALSILVVFERAKDNILSSDNLFPFVILAFIGSSLLLTLLFLVNKPTESKARRTIRKAKGKRRRSS